MLTTVYFILALGFLIFIHEVGHFVAAKIVGIPIQEFGIGFPPRMLTLFRTGGTDFTLNWLPIGGFVRPLERPRDEQIPDELMAAKPWKRIFMLLAGSTVNILASIIMLTFAYYQIGSNLDHVLVSAVVQDSPADNAGIQPNDYITAINGYETLVVEEFQAIIAENKGEPIEVSLLRDGKAFTVELIPRTEYDPLTEGPTGVGLFGPLTFFESATSSVYYLFNVVKDLVNIPFRLVGFKGMFDGFAVAQEMDATGDTITAGTNTIWFLASISFSLGLLNLLPIPIFDGGKILLALPEFFTGWRVPINVYYLLNMVSLGFVLLLMVYVNVQDFVDPSIDLTSLTPTP
jgi:regulator of sigma E protease